jgi:hypothetical protein
MSGVSRVMSCGGRRLGQVPEVMWSGWWSRFLRALSPAWTSTGRGCGAACTGILCCPYEPGRCRPSALSARPAGRTRDELPALGNEQPRGRRDTGQLPTRTAGAGDDLGMVTVSIPRARRLARPGQHARQPCRPRPWLHLVTMAVPQARARGHHCRGPPRCRPRQLTQPGESAGCHLANRALAQMYQGCLRALCPSRTGWRFGWTAAAVAVSGSYSNDVGQVTGNRRAARHAAGSWSCQ